MNMNIRYWIEENKAKYGTKKEDEINPSTIQSSEDYDQYIKTRKDPFQDPQYLKNQKELSELGFDDPLQDLINKN